MKTWLRLLLMGKWIDTTLSSVVTSNNQSINKDYKYQIIEYLDTGSITNGKIDSFQKVNISEAPSRAKRLVKNQDIIYSTVRPIQRHFGFIENPIENLVVSTGFSVIEVNKNLAYPKFIYYFLSSNETVEILDIIAEASTTTYPSLKPKDIENLDISLPPLEEQKSIAEVLSSLNDKIDLLHRQNKTLEQMAQTLFRQWFIEEADDKWEVGELGNFVSTIDNRGKTPPNQAEETPYPVIEVNALGKKDRLVDYSVIRKYVNKETFDTWFRKSPNKYDTLVSTVGSIGAFSMFILEKGNIAQNVIALHPEKISAFYLYEVLKYKRDEIMQLDIGGVQPSIKVPHLLSIEIVKPDKEILDKFDNQIIQYVNKMELNYKQIKTLEKMRDTLLPKLMSGEARVKI